MRKYLYLILFLIFMTAGCSNNELGKKQYYEKGLGFLENENPRGARIAFQRAIEEDQNYFEARYQLALTYISLEKYEKAEKELLKVLRLNPSFYESHISLARIYVNSEKINEALKEINTYLRETKDYNPEAYELLATTYALKKELAKAEEILDETLKKFPDRIPTKLIMSEVYIENEKDSPAETLIHEVLESDDKNKKALFLLAKIRHKQDDIEGLIHTYQRLISIDSENPDVYLQLGLSYLRKRDFVKAKETAMKLKELHANQPGGAYLNGMVFFYKNEIDDAIVSFQESVQRSVIPGAYYYLGLCFLSKGYFEQATSAFQRVIDIRPEIIQARLLLAVTHLKTGRVDNAEIETLEVLKVDDKNAFAHNLLGSIYMALNKGEIAIEEFDRAIELNPRLVDAHIKKGVFKLLSGKVQEAEKEFIDAVEIAPDVLNTRIILARYYIKNKMFQKAIDILNEGLREDPNDVIIYNIIGIAYIGANNTEEAVQYFKKSITTNKKFFLPYFNLALIYYNRGEKEKAINEYKKVIDIDDKNVSAFLMLAKIMEKDKKDEEALAYYKKAKEQGKNIAYMSLANFYQRKKDRVKAVKVLDDALIINPNNIQALDIKGSIFMKEKNFDAALSVYKTMRNLSPDIGKLRMVAVYENMGHYNRAIRELKDLLSGKTDRMQIKIQIAGLYLKKKDYQEAERYAREVISLNPDNGIGYQTLGLVYAAKNKFHNAIDALKTAETLNPENLETKVALGKAYFSLKAYEKAIDIFEEIEKSNSFYVPAYFIHANILELSGKKKAAVEKHKEVLDISPDYVPSLNNLAYLYAEGYGPLEKAVDYARKAKRLAPKNGGVTDTLGWALFKAGNYDDALKKFIEATHYLPGEPTIRYHLGLAYLKKELNVKAEEQLKNAIRLGRQTGFPEFDDTRVLLNDIMQK